jgi:thiol-disulfide isomerase/thioredoxin
VEVAPSVEVTGPGLPRFGEGPDAAVGLVAPSLVGTSFDGSEVRIEPSSKFTVVMFLAHWCPHCQDEVDDLGPFLTTNPLPDNVAVFTVSTGTDERRPNYPPSEWLDPGEWPIPVLVDTADSEASAAFGLNAFPFWVVFDPDGVVLARTAGSLPLESVEALFDNLSALEG